MTTTTQELIDWCEAEYERKGHDRLKYVANHLRAMDKPDCTWTNGEADEVFETQCGNTFTFIDGGITENDCKFCQYCGGAVVSGGLAND